MLTTKMLMMRMTMFCMMSLTLMTMKMSLVILITLVPETDILSRRHHCNNQTPLKGTNPGQILG